MSVTFKNVSFRHNYNGVKDTFLNGVKTHLQDTYLNGVETHKWGRDTYINGVETHINGVETRI